MTEQEHLAARNLISTLLQCARDDRKAAQCEASIYWRDHAAAERRRRLKEALFWRNYIRAHREFLAEQDIQEAA